ncbi:MAG: hypothetical protein NTY38_06330 [Acidobacteria bacterium]|nr:hypothetical protein [Acidobacteriota bacterium]
MNYSYRIAMRSLSSRGILSAYVLTSCIVYSVAGFIANLRLLLFILVVYWILRARSMPTEASDGTSSGRPMPMWQKVLSSFLLMHLFALAIIGLYPAIKARFSELSDETPLLEEWLGSHALVLLVALIASGAVQRLMNLSDSRRRAS